MNASPSLRALAGDLAPRALGPSTDLSFEGVTADSRRVRPGWLFVAVRGHAVDGHRYLGEAAQAGAAGLIVAEDYRGECPQERPCFSSTDPRALLARLVREHGGRADEALLLVAITGTNGKTTTTHLVRGLIEAAGRRCGLLGTLVYDTGARRLPAPLTTPGVEEFFAHLGEMRDAGLSACALEASSHALDQGRLGEAAIDVAGFSNVTREHLDYHPDFDHYLASKLRLLDRLGPQGRPVVNLDDPVLGELAWPARLLGVGEDPRAALRLRAAHCGRDGIELELEYESERFELRAPLRGAYNVSNLLLAAGCALAAGLNPAAIAEAAPGLEPVPGRMEVVELEDGPLALIDYAHTPDGLRSALAACRPFTTGRLWVLFGCGGERDRGKRPLMAKVAAELADRVVLTSDNPRGEDPRQILDDAEAGLRGTDVPWVTLEDRREAILHLAQHAAPEDLLLLAGKGHERYQEVRGERRPWDDREVLRDAWLAHGGERA